MQETFAQDAAKQELKQDQTVPKSGSAAGQQKSDQNAKQEGSSKIEGLNPASDILINGQLTVAGAPTDTDTIPSQYSLRNAASDKLPIAAFALAHLTDDQRKTLRSAIRTGAPGSGSRALEGFANVGALVPTGVALANIRSLPEAIVAQSPGLNGISTTESEGKLLLVNPRTRVVLGVID